MSTAYSPIPTASSSLGIPVWLIAIVIALFVHFLFFINIKAPQTSAQTKEKGIGGIEVGLIRLEAPAAPKPQQTVAPPPEPQIPVKQKPKPVKKKARPIPKPVSKPKPPVIPDVVAEPSPTQTEDVVTDNNVVKSTTTEQVDSQANRPVSLGGANPHLTASYEKTIAAWLSRYKRYPSSARRRGQEDTISLEFTIDKDGNVLSKRIVKKSSYGSLNKAVLKMIKRASPLPPVPASLRGSKTRFTYTVPVEFTLKK